MTRMGIAGALLVAVAALGTRTARADEDGAPARFDAVNQPLAQVLEKAAAADKPVFVEFFLDG